MVISMYKLTVYDYLLYDPYVNSVGLNGVRSITSRAGLESILSD